MEYSVRFNLKEMHNGFTSYSTLMTIVDENGKTAKYSLEDARKVARKRLDTPPHNGDNYVIPYCKIYQGRKCIETIYK
jgi:hypothetical protein